MEVERAVNRCARATGFHWLAEVRGRRRPGGRRRSRPALVLLGAALATAAAGLTAAGPTSILGVKSTGDVVDVVAGNGNAPDTIPIPAGRPAGGPAPTRLNATDAHGAVSIGAGSERALVDRALPSSPTPASSGPDGWSWTYGGTGKASPAALPFATVGPGPAGLASTHDAAALSATCQETTITAPVLADAWIGEGSTSNKGSDAVLSVEANPSSGNVRALIRFGLPAGVPVGCVVESARLRLFTSSGSEGARVEVLRLASGWTEGGVVWSNQPATVGGPATAWSTGGYMQWNVSALVQAMLEGSNHGFLIRDADEGTIEGGASHGFNSREKGEDPPQLVIRFAAPPSGEPPAPPAPPTPAAVSCGQVLTESTLVTNNLSNCPGDGLVIGAPRIIVDLDGHTIDGVGLGAGVHNEGFASVTVRNGTVQDFDHGVLLLSETALNVVEALTLRQNQLAAVELFDARDGNEIRSNTVEGNGEGIALVSGTTGTVVEDNTMILNSGAGVLVRNSNANRLARNTVNGGGDLGIGLEHAVGNTLLDNEVSNTSDGGIELRYGSNDNRVEANFVSEAGDTGIMVDESVENELLWNTTRLMSDAGITLNTADDSVVRGNDVRFSPGGLQIDGSSRLVVEANNASDSSGTGIELGGDSYDNRIVLNVANDNGAIGIYVSGEALTEPGNIIESNVASGNAADGIALAKGGHTVTANFTRNNRGWGINAGDGSIDGGRNVASGNGQPGQCIGVLCNAVAPPPDTDIDHHPDDPTSSTSASFEFDVDDLVPESELRFECRFAGGNDGGGDFLPCASPVTHGELSDGSYTFEVRAVVGGTADPTPASFTWTVDTVAPETTIESGPAGWSGSATAVFSFSASEPGSSFQCRLDDAEFAACESPASYPGLAEGAHAFEVRAIDQAGNVDASPASSSFTVDTIAPETVIVAGPTGLTGDSSPEFAFESEPGASFECRVDDAPFDACVTPFTTASLPDGEHTFEVRAVDAAGNVDASPASSSFTVDTTPPETEITAGPSDPTASTSAAFGFTADDPGASFLCALDDGVFSACAPGVLYTGLAEGAHTFFVKAVDAAGNEDGSPASRSFTVDLTAPETTIASGPSGLVASTTAVFTFSSSEPGSSFECALDGAVFAGCASGVSYEDLAQGAHSFEVRAIDPAGNVDATAATGSFTVDTIAPETTIGSGPSGLVASATAVFAFSSSESGSSFECRLDDATFAGCVSPRSYPGLAEGAHTFEVRAVDAAGNVDATPATRSFTVDTVAPETAIDSGPSALGNDASPSFAFSSEPGAVFACSLDGAPFAECASPFTPPLPLAEGPHSFEVAAADAAGNVDPTPANRIFTVDTTPPDVVLVSGPDGVTGDATPEFAFSSGEDGVSFTCSLEPAVAVACVSPFAPGPLAEGAYTLVVTAVDAAGNPDPSPASRSFSVDLTPPETTIESGPSGLVASATAAFAFSSSESGSSFECSLDGAAFAGCVSGGSYDGLAQGAHSFEVRAIDTAGNVDATAAGRSFTVDTVAPETQIDSGATGLGNDATPTFAFSASEPAAFRCRLDLADFAACDSPFTPAPLAEGAHTFEVFAVDPAGNVDASPASSSFTVDTVPPDVVFESGPAGATASTTPAFEFSAGEDGVSFTCSLEPGVAVACVSPFAPGPLAEGAYTLVVGAVDAAGNPDPSPASRSFSVDLTQPETTISSGPAALTMSTTAIFIFSSSEAGGSFECRLDAGDYLPCDRRQTYRPLSDGPHTFEVRAIDAAGNVDATPAARQWTVDTTAPETEIVSGPSGLGNDSTPTFTFSASESATFQCRVDLAAFAACTSPHTTATLGEGPHTFEVRAVDAAGNADASPAARSFTVDTIAPETEITAGPSGPTASSSAAFGFTSDDPGASFVCALDGGAFTGCGPGVLYAGLGEGAHTFVVKAADGAGNEDPSPASRSFMVDLTPPDTTIDSGPAGTVAATDAIFAFSASEEATFECSLDGGAFGSCTSPHALSGLADGGHELRVRATDAAGNVDATPATREWTVDTTAPETQIVSGPSGLGNDSTPTFTFSASESGVFECRVGLAVFAACTSPHTTSALAEGPHMFEVRALDGVGNADGSPASRAFSIDTTAPETTIDSGPPATITSTSATFTFSSPDLGASFECALDGAAFTGCSSPLALTGVTAGLHGLEVRARDVAGNLDPTPASYEWTVQSADTTPPDTTISAGPSGPTSDSTPTFAFSASEAATFQCRVDSGAFAACSSPHTTAALGEGAHTFEVRAVDLGGNVDPTPASRSFSVDTVGPETTITSGPAGPTNDSTPTFAFSASESATFQCRVDSASFATCASPFTTAALGQGARTFEVRAVDALGNADATPASRVFTVDTVAPDTTITSGPAGPTNDSTPTYSFSANESATFQCRVDTGTFATCASPFTTASLGQGAHTFEVRALDAAGNVDASAASRAFTVDTVVPETTIASGPTGPTSDSTPTFTFSANESGVSFACATDLGPFAPCISPHTLAALGDGAHTLWVRATDAAENVDATPASRGFTVDTTLPTATITSGPTGPITLTSAQFAFSANEAVLRFECSLDTAAFTTCASPISYAGLALGAHQFRVRAVDLAGNVGAPALRAWSITAPPDTTPPVLTLTGPASGTQATSASFTFSANEPATFMCSLDSAPFAACSSGVGYSGLQPGTHVFRLEARDATGNLGIASHTWTISAPPPPGTCTAGTTQTVGANADTWVLQSSASSNYGNDSAIKVDSKSGANARVLVRFALPAIPAGCRVTSARLRMYAGSYKTGRTLQAIPLAAAWNEGSVTWTNQPATTGQTASVASGSGYREWTVTQQVEAMYAPSANNGFLIRDSLENGNGIEQAFNSREKGTDNPPQLVLTFG